MQDKKRAMAFELALLELKKRTKDLAAKKSPADKARLAHEQEQIARLRARKYDHFWM